MGLTLASPGVEPGSKGSVATGADRQREVMVRRLPYGLALLAVAVAIATAPALDTSATLPYVVAAAVVAVCWHWFAVDRRWGVAPIGDRTGGAYIVGRTALAFLVTWLNPIFAIFALVGYLDAYAYLSGRPRSTVLVVTAVTMAGAQSGGLPPASNVHAIAFAGLFVLNAGLVLFLQRMTDHEDALVAERDRTIIELERTNAALAAALAENQELHARLLERARQAGVADERERLALEIHDTLAQDLIGIITQLDAAAEAADPAAARRHHDRAAVLARQGLTEARRSVQALAPGPLTGAELPAVLETVVSDWSRGVGVAANVVVDGTAEPLHRDVEATILRVAQEALSNVARHACAGRVGVTLAYMGDLVTLDLRDDGVGFDAGRQDRAAGPVSCGDGGNGLAGMSQRARRVGGRLVVESEPGAGTAVSLQVPVPVGDPSCGSGRD